MADQISKGCAFTDPILVGAVIDNSVIGATTKAAASFTALTATGASTLSGNLVLGTNASSTEGHYGTTPVSQRSSSLQTSSNVVTSASFGTLQVAQIQEVLNILNTLGLSKGT